jgi:amino acid adenylation domain-containing protein
MAFLLHQLLSEAAAKYPDRKAIIFKDLNINYQDLEEMSNKLAHTLVETGIKRGDRVGIFIDKSISSVLSVFGILKSGGMYVPIPTDAPKKRIEYIVNNCGITNLISVPEKVSQLESLFPGDCPFNNIILVGFKAPASNLRANIITWETILSSTETVPPSLNSVDRDLAFILYTSGSTGDPKGVMTSHLNALTYVNWATEFFNIRKEDKVAGHSPLQFNLSIFDIFATFKAGATLVIIPDGTAIFPIKLAELIENEKISIWYSVPSILVLLVNFGKLERFKFSNLRLVIFAGEIFQMKYLRKLKKYLPSTELYHQYGQTEAYPSTYYHVTDLPDDDAARIPIGKPVPNFDVFALDENNLLISRPGDIGEVYVFGSSVAQGYWGDSEKTNAAFVENPFKKGSRDKAFKTGDLVTVDENGNFVFLSRKDNMIKSRGYRIELNEIEVVISSHPKVKEVAVIDVPDELIGSKIVAYLVPFEDDKLTTDDIIEHCSTRLPRYMIPEIGFQKSLPRTSTGKIDKKTLKSEYPGHELREAN